MNPTPNRVTIIRDDGVIIVDGRAIHDLDMSALDPQIHALQWAGGRGHIELKADAGSRCCNIAISSLDPFADVLAQWRAAADAEDHPPPRAWAEQLSDAQHAIDQAAGQARAAYVSPGFGTEMEYARAGAQAREFLAAVAANPDAPVPAGVASEAAASAITAVEAAQKIAAAAARLECALDAIRAARLLGRATVAGLSAADPTHPTPEESAALREATDLAVASVESLRP